MAKFWKKNKTFQLKQIRTKKNFIALKCFLIHLEKFIWDMSEIIQLEMFFLVIKYKKVLMCSSYGLGLFWYAAENAAKSNNLDPKIWTEENISVMKSQLEKLGLSIDWDREISTCSPKYYKHQQKFF